jgi:2-phospho-L-lactate/phosphoenolpyruvate guanylyltransferase
VRAGSFHFGGLRRTAGGKGLVVRGILLIPVKSLTTAKQRLAAALNPWQRSQLAEAMLRDVMAAASGVRNRLDVALVTGDARAQHLARKLGFDVIEDTRNESETAAIEMATAWCEQRGYDTTVVVPGDIPLITSEELHRVLDAAPTAGAVFVPAYDRRGSNCILRRPGSLIPLRFGNDSFLPHCEALRNTGRKLVVLEMPGIGLDIDNPHELDLLLRREGNTNAQQLLRSWAFSDNEAQWEAAV